MSTSVKKFFLIEIENVMKEVLDLIKERELGNNTGIEKDYELQAILNDLRKIKSQLITNSVPQKSQRFLSYETFITDKWGIRHPLGSKLLDIASKYTYAL